MKTFTRLLAIGACITFTLSACITQQDINRMRNYHERATERLEVYERILDALEEEKEEEVEINDS